MDLLQFVLILVAVAVIMWAVHKYIPMWPPVLKILDIVVVVAVILWVLRIFGVLSWVSGIRVGR